MEKPQQAKTNKNSILKFLPKAASAVTFQNLSFSPGREKRSDNNHKHKANAGRGFSGPIVSIIPDEARRKPRNYSFEGQEEPTSPKVSCMGQIKRKKKTKEAKHVSAAPTIPKKEVKAAAKPEPSAPQEGNKKSSRIKRLFSGKKPGRRSSASDGEEDYKPSLADKVPSLSQMKRFASGRDTLANFDWTAHQIAPVEYSDNLRGYYSDEERDAGAVSDQEEEEEAIIPFSAPLTLGDGVALRPKKEVNLWKRRTMNPPKPLQLNPTAKVS